MTKNAKGKRREIINLIMSKLPAVPKSIGSTGNSFIILICVVIPRVS